MNMRLQTWRNYADRTNILKTSEGLRSPRMGTLDTDALTLSSEGRGKIPMGTFFVRQANELYAPLPWTHLAENAAAAATELDISEDTISFFKVGDVLSTPPHAHVTLSGTWAANDTLAIDIGDITITVTALSADATAIAEAAVAAINGNQIVQDSVFAAALDGAFHVFAQDSRLPGYLAFDVTATTAGDGDAAITGAKTSLTPTSVGTVSAVNLDTYTLTLESGIAIAMPAEAPVYADFLGTIEGWITADIHIPDGNADLGLHISGTPETELMPFWNKELAHRFPMTAS